MSVAQTWLGRSIFKFPQQVRIDGMSGLAPAGAGLPVQRLDTHLLHQRPDVFATDRLLFSPEHVSASGCRQRDTQMQFIDPAHQRQVGREVGSGV